MLPDRHFSRKLSVQKTNVNITLAKPRLLEMDLVFAVIMFLVNH